MKCKLAAVLVVNLSSSTWEKLAPFRHCLVFACMSHYDSGNHGHIELNTENIEAKIRDSQPFLSCGPLDCDIERP